MSAHRVSKVKGKLLGSREELVVLILGVSHLQVGDSTAALRAELPEVT